MNICILSRSLPCHLQGGLEYHTMTLAKALLKKEHKIYILTTQNKSPHSLSIPENNIEIIHLPGTKPGQYNFAYFYNSIREIFQNKSIDIVHSQGFAAFGYMFKKKFPLVTTIHGTLTSETDLFYHTTWKNIWKYKKRLVVKPLYKQLLDRADMISVDSEFSRNLLLFNNPKIQNKLYTIPLGIDTEFFHPFPKDIAKEKFNLPAKFTILTLGRLTESKGIQVVIKAISKLKDLDILLVIAGTGPYKATLEKLTAEYQLSNVLFTGEVENELKPPLYSAADIFIHPDLTAPAFGLVAVEAMACGTPVIASHTGALPEIISSDTGMLFPRYDSEHLSSLIQLMYQQKSICKEMASCARNRATVLYNSDKMAGQIESMYSKVVLNHT